MEESEGSAVEVLPVLGEPPAAAEPGEGPLDHPAPGQNDEPDLIGRLADDLDDDIRRPGDPLVVVGAVGEDAPDAREQGAGGLQQRAAAVPVLDGGGVDPRLQQQAERIGQDMTLLAPDLLAGVIAMRVDARPPFSALFTLWLSMMAAVGPGSRPSCSRQAT